MSASIPRFRVVVFEETVGPELRDVLRLLDRAGYQAAHAEEPEQWFSAVDHANCGLLMAYRLSRALLPSPFGNGHVPPFVLVSPLRPEDAIRDAPDPGVVDTMLQPVPPDPVLVRAVTRAVITDSFRRLEHAIRHDPGLTEPLRAMALAVLVRHKRRVGSGAHSAGVKPRTVQKHWADRFGEDAPRPIDLCRGMWLLQVIREAISEQPRSWHRVRADLMIPRSTLRDATLKFVGGPPSEVDLETQPGLTVAHILAGAVPAELLARVLEAEGEG